MPYFQSAGSNGEVSFLLTNHYYDISFYLGNQQSNESYDSRI